MLHLTVGFRSKDTAIFHFWNNCLVWKQTVFVHHGHYLLLDTWTSGGGGGVLIVQIAKKMELWTKSHINQICGTFKHFPYSDTFIDQTKHNFMAFLPNFDVHQKGTRCFRRSFTSVLHCQKGILTPEGTWLRILENCIICSPCLKQSCLKLVLISPTLHFEPMGEEPGDTGGRNLPPPPKFNNEVKFPIVNIHSYKGNEHIYRAFLQNSLAVQHKLKRSNFTQVMFKLHLLIQNVQKGISLVFNTQVPLPLPMLVVKIGYNWLSFPITNLQNFKKK